MARVQVDSRIAFDTVQEFRWKRGSYSYELFAGFDEYLVEQFVRRTAVGKFRIVTFKIVRALDAAVFPRYILLRNIDSERIRAVALLKLDLAFTGKEPVHEKFGGIRMRRFINEADPLRLFLIGGAT